MARFEAIGKSLEIYENSESKKEFSDDALSRFDELMEENNEVTSKELPSVLENIFEDVKKKIEGDKFGEMGTNCRSIMNDMETVFEDSNWENLSPEDRAKAFDEVAKRIGRECNIEIKGVKYFWFPPNVRGFENGDGYLHLHEKYLSDSSLKEDALHTLFHEARHTFQNAAIQDPDSYGVDARTAEKWKRNLENYLTPEKFGYYRYYKQPVEVDANEFADYVLKNRGDENGL